MTQCQLFEYCVYSYQMLRNDLVNLKNRNLHYDFKLIRNDYNRKGYNVLVVQVNMNI